MNNKLLKSEQEVEQLIDKLNFEISKYGASFSLIMFKLIKGDIKEFVNILYNNLRISDSIFILDKDTVIIILEETILRGALVLSKRLNEIFDEEYKNKFIYKCAAIQGDGIDRWEHLLNALKRRMKKAMEEDDIDCVYELSFIE